MVLKQLVRVGHFTIGMVEVYKALDILWVNRMINHRVLALNNIRPRQGNLGMEIEDPKLRDRIETITRALLQVNP